MPASASFGTAHRRRLVRRGHRRRPRVPDRRAQGASMPTAGSTTPSSTRTRTRLRGGAGATPPATTGTRSSARAARPATGDRGVRAAADRRPKAVFVWSMGLTQHAHGVDTVQALVNVGLARGLPARPGSGLMPIRGHSGVQGGAEVGCVPGRAADARARWARGVGLRRARGSRDGRPPEMIDASAAGELDLFWMVGGNFLETLPDPARGRGARWRGRACASTRTSCCRRRCWSTAPATCCCCRPRRATNRRAAAPRPPPSGASSSRPRSRAGASAPRSRSGRCSAR